MKKNKNNKKQLLKILDRFEKRQEIITQNLDEILEWQKSTQIQTAFVTSAIPLTNEQKRQLVVNLGFIFGKSFSVENRVDKSILGGLKIQIGSQIIDNTLANQITKIKVSLQTIN